MKNTVRFLVLVVSAFILTTPSFAQWIQTGGPSMGRVYSYTVTPTGIFAGTISGVFRSVDNGRSWKSTGRLNGPNYGVFAYGSKIYATYAIVNISTDDGRTWYRSYTGLDGDGCDPYVFAAVDTVLFLAMRGCTGDVYCSSDLGATWNFAESGLTDKTAQAFAVIGTTLFAGTTEHGVFRTTNMGKNWSHASAGLTDDNILTLAANGSNLFAGSNEGHVFFSSNGGSSWTRLGGGLPEAPIQALTVASPGDSLGTTYLFAATPTGVYRTADNGASWAAVNMGLADTNIISLAAVPAGDGTGGMTLLAGIGNWGVARSTDYGATWASSVIPCSGISAVGASSTALFADANEQGLFRSGDNGATWMPIGMQGPEIVSFASFGPSFFAGTSSGGVMHTTNDGESWEGVGAFSSGSVSFAGSADGSGNIFAGSTSAGVAISPDGGTTWRAVNNGLTDLHVYGVAATPPDTSATGYVFAATISGVFRSPDNGATWTMVNDLTGKEGHAMLASAQHGETAILVGTGNSGVIRSTDNGNTWSAPSGSSFSVSAMVSTPDGTGGTDVFGLFGNDVFISTDNGLTWAIIGSYDNHLDFSSIAISHFGGQTSLFAGTWGQGVWQLPLATLMVNDTSWNAVDAALTGYCIASIVSSPTGDGSGRSVIFAIARPESYEPNYPPQGSLYRSTDYGKSWTNIVPSLNNDISCLAVVPAAGGPGGTNLLAGTYSGYLPRSTDNGDTWTGLPPAPGNIKHTKGPFRNVLSIAVVPDGTGGTIVLLGATGHGSGIWRSTDNGSTWAATNGVTYPPWSLAYTSDTGGTRLFASYKSGLYFSTDGGMNWADVRPIIDGWSLHNIFCDAARGNQEFLGAEMRYPMMYDALLRSTDGGSTWNNVHPEESPVYALAFCGSTLFTGTCGGGIYLSSDFGTSWARLNSGLKSLCIHSFAFCADSSGAGWAFAGTSGCGVWRYPLSTALISAAINLRAIGGLTPGLNVKQVSLTASLKPDLRSTASVPRNGRMLLSWTRDHHSDFLSYRLYADTVPHPRSLIGILTGSLSDTVRLVTGLLEDRPYYFRVTAMDNSGYENNWSNEVNATPAPPMKITAIPGMRRVLLHWAKDERSGVARYRIYGDTSAAPVALIDSTIGGATDTTKILHGLADCVAYYFRITAIDTQGFECDWSNVNTATPGLFRPPLSAVPGNGQVLLTWGKTNLLGLMRCRIYGGTSPHPAALIDSTAGGPTDTSKLVGGLTNGVPYYFRVTAVDSFGLESDYSNEVPAMPDVFVLPLSIGWNMVAVPMTVPDYRRSVLFPFAVSSAFAFDGGYAMKDTLANGKAYWIKLGGSSWFSLDGTPRTLDTVEVRAGWNMIGSIASPLPVVQIASDPGGLVTSQFYTFMHGYVISDTIQPGRGYWVKTDRSGKLILSAPAATMKTPPAPPGEILNQQPAIPDHYALDQNYPNPFNPTTDFGFRIVDCGLVTLKVYDVLGREVATLVNEVKQPGAYTVTWDASRMPSGIYFYRLQTGRFTATKKLLLLK
ncbi:MAG: T9SS type A sorting domain-containing protein [Bacteroidota bacterium]